MEYQKTNVVAFLGLDNNQRPELIKDQEASDIENLRFDKLGYLINRNGVQNVGVSMSRTIDADVDYPGFLRGIGAMGIAEYVIEAPWGDKNLPAGQDDAVSPYDDNTLTHFTGIPAGTQKYTDRFMVYSIRIPAHKHDVFARTDANNDSNRNAAGAPTHMDNQYTWRYKAAYILVPLTGPQGFRDSFAFAPNGNQLNGANNYQPVDQTLPTLLATIGSRSIVRADDKPKKLQIYAPSRWLGVHNEFADNGIPKDLNWIEHYVSMQQYRESLVISDMTNGDAYLVDEYMESEFQDTKKHRFTLRENALAHFDVDDVVVDFGIGGFNEGVKAPMALYKFYLKRSSFVTPNDGYKGTFVDEKESPTIDRIGGNPSDWEPLDPGDVGTFISVEKYHSKSQAVLSTNRINEAGVTFNAIRQYTYTNQAETNDFDDLLSTLTLQNPDILEDDQVSSDVYLWKDFEIQYYPSSGVSNQVGYYLTEQDRTWDKTSSAGTKLIKLKNRTGVEQNVPLGVWRYRFVWYLGNGEYSAPSSELVVPDLIFSGISDADIIAAKGSYSRPVGLDSYRDAVSTHMDLSSAGNLFLNDLSVVQGIKIFQNDAPPTSGTLTSFGLNFVKVKERLYFPSHRFAALKSSTAGNSWPSYTGWNTETYESKGNLGVICSIYFTHDDVPLEGYVAEAAYSDITYEGRTTNTYKATPIKLVVPVFKQESSKYTYNSIFTDSGVPRLVFQNISRYSASPLYNANRMAYDIVFTGKTALPPNVEVAKDGGQIYYNVVALPGAFLFDKNNKDDDDVYSGQQRLVYRNMTQLRAVRSQGDRLSFVRSNIPAEVTSRLILQGTAEFPLCSFGDAGTFRIDEGWTVPAVDTLGYDTDRQYINPLTDGNLWHSASTLNPAPFTTVSKRIKSNDPGYLAATPQIRFSNIEIKLYGIGERLTIHEQLSMYVPASLLFDAPHVKLVIPTNRIPRRARQLLVFRTRASHDNAWQPHDYGLVKAIDIKRNASGVPVDYADNRLSFLDDVKSSELDYSYALNDYDGFTKPIKSRFCLPLNERVFYANFKESYKPHTPRTSLDVVNTHAPDTTVVPHRNLNFGSQAEMAKLWSYKLFTATQTGDATITNITSQYLYYFIAYNDQARSFSLASCSGEINRGASFATDKNKPVFFCMPSAYDPSVEQANIYRLQLSAPIEKITFTTSLLSSQIPAGRSYYVLQGLVEYNGVVYYPNDVIQTFDGNDVGYDQTRVNRFINYFEMLSPTTSDRGNAASYCQPILYNVTNYFDGSVGPNYIEKIGTIKPEDEGIFYDNDLPSLGRLPLKQIFQNEDVMPAGLRWSEPYQSNKIKLSSLMEVRSGDGDQITGIAMLYGNLIVLKERSIHRLAVQGSTVPVSRVDEISNNIGCIAPNTVITVNNTLYFLSWAGFYKYDNNVLSKVDGNFAEELQLRLRSSQNGVTNPAIRDASCGWNAAYRELYLTIPVMSTSTNEGNTAGQYQDGVTLVDNKDARIIRGITYALNIDNGLVTKYRYMDDSIYFTDPTIWQEQVYPYAPRQRAPRVYGRLYHTNSLGQMRSAEILPPRTYNYLDATLAPLLELWKNDASMEFMRASFFIESPTKDLAGRDKPKDDYLTFIQDPITNQFGLASTSKFVRVYWASKSWTADDKSVLKRIRKVFTYISASDDPTIIRGIVHTSPEGAQATTDISWQYTFRDDRPLSSRFGYSVTGELLSIPTEANGSSFAPSQNRGERHLFEVEGSGAFQMEYFAFHWKPINQYER